MEKQGHPLKALIYEVNVGAAHPVELPLPTLGAEQSGGILALEISANIYIMSACWSTRFDVSVERKFARLVSSCSMKIRQLLLYEVGRSGLLVRLVSFYENAVDLATAILNRVVTVVGA